MAKKKNRGSQMQARPAADVWAGWEGASAVKYADAGEVLSRLAQVVDERDRLGALAGELVAQGRRKGLTWTELGRALGVTPQAVQKRYGGAA